MPEDRPGAPAHGWTALRLNAVTYPVEPGEREALAAAGARLVEVEGRDEAELQAHAAACDALLVVSAYVPASLVAQMGRCLTIARLGAGTDRIDIAAATAAGIVVSNVPDFCLGEQADHTIGLLLALARRLPWMQAAMRRGDWTARQDPKVRRLAGRTLGLLGFGASAQAVAQRAAALGLRVQAWTRRPEAWHEAAERLGVRMLPFDELLAGSDFLSVHLPLAPQTRHLVGARELALLRPHVQIVNTARGAIFDEAALVEHLRTHPDSAAALDVFEGIDVFQPPGTPASHPLLELDNVICTPHSAGSSVESTAESKLRGAQHAAQVLAGRWPTHVVNPGVQPRAALQGREPADRATGP
jgi:D-3-phosphoglycerate dehydrogenase